MPAATHRFRFVRTAATGAVGAGLVAVLTACGTEDPDAGTNGVGKLPAAQVEERALRAADAAGAVRLTGTLVSEGRTYRLDMRLKDNGGIGEVSAAGGARFELLRVGEDLYLKADAAFWTQQGDEDGEPSAADREAAGKLDGKYVKVPPGDPAYAQLSGFTEKDVLLDGVLALSGERAKGERGEVDGVRTVRVTAGGGVLDVSLDGKPFPLRLERAGDTGVLTMADWGKQFSLRAPQEDQIVDYGKEISTQGGEAPPG
ncbi:hypothetical protein V1J52_05835 [Streptomyces sp. TRM 70351]|uniref:hypothetical protein n=1 Tax=Streptomyces sp. TRM 70351 TaxID=3116552 RepID=UPI002E7AEEBB|nr:hypothetical protein [Streptomyces sp. TRM 70351]MEE1927715.1 hypothetical protein [Streptomyces sp. TRM 70351]